MRSKKVIKNVFSSLILQIVILISGLIVPKIIIKTFGSNVNGLVSSITQFLTYIALLESGFGPVVKSALYKPIAKKDEKSIKNILHVSEQFFKKISFIFIIYLIFLSVLYPIITNDIFSYFYTFSLVIIISISTFFEYYFGITYKLYLQANQETYITSYIQIAVYILNIFIVLLLVRLNAGIHIIKILSSLIFIARPIIQNLYVKKKYNINLKGADDNFKLEQKWDGLAQHIASVVHNNTDMTVLTIFSSLTSVSIYSVYNMVTKGIKSIVSSFSGGIDASFGDMIAKDEKENLNQKFDTYETIYNTIATIFYVCTLILIIPFIKVYTKDITDVNYIIPAFGYLIVLSEFIWAIRVPYSSITLAAGHFKQTRKGAWVEAILNIVISVILVIKYGIIGVAIGTFISMAIRTIEFVYHTNKYILERSMFITIKKIFIIVLEVIFVVTISKFISLENINSYQMWLVYAILIFAICSIVTIGVNYIFFKKDFKNVLKIMKK